MGRFKANFTKAYERITKDIEGGGGKFDERFWYPQGDRSQDQMYKFNLLPSKPIDGEYGGICYEKVIFHKFEYIDDKGKKKNYNKPCNKMLGQECPLCEKVSELWDKDKDSTVAFTEEDGRLRTMLNLKHRYITNVYIVDDPETPDNNGKVFMTQFPAKGQDVIFNKVLKQMQPTDLDLRKDSFVEFNPYEPFNTAVFEYYYTAPKGKDLYGNYSSSAFSTKVRSLAKSEDKTGDIIDSAYDLEEYLEEYTNKCLPYDELIAKFTHLLDGDGSNVTVEKEEISDDDIYGEDTDDSKDDSKTGDPIEKEESVDTKEEEKSPIKESSDDPLDELDWDD